MLLDFAARRYGNKGLAAAFDDARYYARSADMLVWTMPAENARTWRNVASAEKPAGGRPRQATRPTGGLYDWAHAERQADRDGKAERRRKKEQERADRASRVTTWESAAKAEAARLARGDDGRSLEEKITEAKAAWTDLEDATADAVVASGPRFQVTAPAARLAIGRGTDLRNAQAAAYRAERAEGIRDGFPRASQGGGRLRGVGGPQPQSSLEENPAALGEYPCRACKVDMGWDNPTGACCLDCQDVLTGRTEPAPKVKAPRKSRAKKTKAATVA